MLDLVSKNRAIYKSDRIAIAGYGGASLPAISPDCSGYHYCLLAVLTNL
jgi:hypothetical protein